MCVCWLVADIMEKLLDTLFIIVIFEKHFSKEDFKGLFSNLDKEKKAISSSKFFI